MSDEYTDDPYCTATCSHGGICSLEGSHEGDHSASGYCTWPRGDWDHYETTGELIVNTLAVMAGDRESVRNRDIPEEVVREADK